MFEPFFMLMLGSVFVPTQASWFQSSAVGSVAVSAADQRMADQPIAVANCVTPEHYEKITFGMTKQQVTAILGRPPETNVTESERSSSYGGTISSFTIMSEGQLWRSKTRRLWVRFDEMDLVTGKMLQGGRGD